MALYEYHENVVKTLIRQGADVNAQVGVFGSALQAASCYGHEKVVRLLMEQRADVNALKEVSMAMRRKRRYFCATGR